jgi:hypothetical protein
MRRDETKNKKKRALNKGFLDITRHHKEKFRHHASIMHASRILSNPPGPSIQLKKTSCYSTRNVWNMFGRFWVPFGDVWGGVLDSGTPIFSSMEKPEAQALDLRKNLDWSASTGTSIFPSMKKPEAQALDHVWMLLDRFGASGGEETSMFYLLSG